MSKKILLSLQIAGLSAFFLLMGSSVIFADTGPSSESSQLKDFYRYVFGLEADENINFSTNPKIDHSVISDNAIESNNITDGTIQAQDIANKSIQRNHLSNICPEDSIIVFDNVGDVVCTPKTAIGIQSISSDATLTGTGKSDSPLSVNLENVQEKVDLSSECIGDNVFVVGFQAKTGEGEEGIEFKCVSVAEDEDGDNQNEIQDVVTNGGLSRDGDKNFKIIDCNNTNEVLKWNGSQWSCQADLVNEDTNLSDEEVITIITNAGFLKNFTEQDPTVKNFAKSDLPNCTDGQVLKSSGGNFECVTDQNTQTENTDNQQISLSQNSLNLEDGGSIDLSKYLDNTDTQLSDDTVKEIIQTENYIKSGDLSGAETDPVFINSNLNTKITVSDEGSITTLGEITTSDGNDWLRLSSNNDAGYSRIRWGDNPSDKLSFYFDDWQDSKDKEVMTLSSAGSMTLNGNLSIKNSDGRSFAQNVNNDGNAYLNYIGGEDNNLTRIGFQIDGQSKMSVYKSGDVKVHSGNFNVSKKITSLSTLAGDSATTVTTKDYVDAKISGTVSNITESDPKLFEKNLDKMTVTSDGNVGIGTSTPSAKLHVAGGAIFETDSNSTPLKISRTNISDNQFLNIGLSDGSTLFHYKNDEAIGSIAFRIQNTDTETGGGANANDNTIMTLVGTANGGNVGIGTTTPTEKLEVSGNIKSSGKITSASTVAGDSATTVTTKDYVDAKISGGIENINNPVATITYNSGEYFGNAWGKVAEIEIPGDYNDATFSLDFAGEEGAANIGTINTVMRNSNISVNPSSLVAHTSIDNFSAYNGDKKYSPQFKVIANTATNNKVTYELWMNKYEQHTNYKFYKNSENLESGVIITYQNSKWQKEEPTATVLNKYSVTQDGFERKGLSQDASFVGGNIGIGLDNPQSKLDIAGSFKIRPFKDFNHNFDISILNTIRTTLTDNYGDIVLMPKDNVGIGTTTPSAKLEVNGWYGRSAHNVGGLVGSYNNVGSNASKTNPIYIIGSNYKPDDSTLANMYGIGYTLNNNSSFITNGTSSWGMYVAADGDARVFIAASSNGTSYFNTGNLGIGTTTPSEKLEVSGNIKSSGKITSASTVAADSATTVTTKDYVDGKISGEIASIVETDPEISARNLDKITVTSDGRVDMKNHSIINVNAITINDPGKNEGILWTKGGANAAIYVSPLEGSVNMNTTGFLRVINSDSISLEAGGEGSNTMILLQNGNVGIGTTSPSEKLEVAGKVKATAFLQSSDENLKENIVTISNSEKILDLRGVLFDWKDSGEHDLGFIAQEVEKLFPELVVTGKNGLKSVKYGNISAILLELLKSQNEKLTQAEKRISELESQNSEILKRLEALEK